MVGADLFSTFGASVGVIFSRAILEMVLFGKSFLALAIAASLETSSGTFL
jgi:hypothetical protein